MSEITLHIKNMVCDRCITAVKQVLEQMAIPVIKIDLGKAVIKDTTIDLNQLNVALQKLGFELVKDKNQILTERVKALIIYQIHYADEAEKTNFSDYLSRKLNMNYAGISKIFSQTEQITIEKFIILQKIEKVKELIDYGELNFSEIAFKLHYSSVAHLSRQFKKVTGLTLSQYKNSNDSNRNTLDKLQ